MPLDYAKLNGLFDRIPVLYAQFSELAGMEDGPEKDQMLDAFKAELEGLRKDVEPLLVDFKSSMEKFGRELKDALDDLTKSLKSQ